MQVFVRLQDADFVIREFDTDPSHVSHARCPSCVGQVHGSDSREALDQRELVLDLTSFRLGLLLGFL